MVNIHARTEPHSRYAIFFIQSGGQVKNIVLNIIVQTTRPLDTFIRDTRARLGKCCPEYRGMRPPVITMEVEQENRGNTMYGNRDAASLAPRSTKRSFGSRDRLFQVRAYATEARRKPERIIVILRDASRGTGANSSGELVCPMHP